MKKSVKKTKSFNVRIDMAPDGTMEMGFCHVCKKSRKKEDGLPVMEWVTADSRDAMRIEDALVDGPFALRTLRAVRDVVTR